MKYGLNTNYASYHYFADILFAIVVSIGKSDPCHYTFVFGPGPSCCNLEWHLRTEPTFKLFVYHYPTHKFSTILS